MHPQEIPSLVTAALAPPTGFFVPPLAKLLNLSSNVRWTSFSLFSSNGFIAYLPEILEGLLDLQKCPLRLRIGVVRSDLM